MDYSGIDQWTNISIATNKTKDYSDWNLNCLDLNGKQKITSNKLLLILSWFKLYFTYWGTAIDKHEVLINLKKIYCEFEDVNHKRVHVLALWGGGLLSQLFWGRRGRHRKVVGFTTTYAISAYHH